MIPFSILSIKMHNNDGSVLEIRALELSKDSLSFRLPHGYLSNHGEPELFELSFFIWQEQKYKSISISEFLYTKICEYRFWEEYEFKTADPFFSQLSNKLSAEYLEYIYLKCEKSDEELTEALTKKTFCTEGEYGFELISKQSCENTDSFEVYDWGLAIETPVRLNLYLENDIDKYVDEIFEKSGLKEHILTRIKFKYLYLGNSYCPRLLPEIASVKKAIVKAKKEKNDIVFVFPPISESEYDHILEYAKELAEAGISEFQVNDLGLLNHLMKNKKIRVTKGVLLTKHRRDPRSIYLEAADENVMKAQNELYMPFYQTNTGTFCPLYAAVKRGGRKNQTRVLDCDCICDKFFFEYPKYLNMTGRYNSLFGVNMQFMDNPDYLAGYLNEKERPVINL